MIHAVTRRLAARAAVGAVEAIRAALDRKPTHGPAAFPGGSKARRHHRP
ncbi:hypothetical protein [Streptomyces scabiei]|nr:hypothetical protein [Streptomyces scabiei]MDX3521330.1 hypothetical protein [Streptomyces scabiei]